MKLFDNPSFTIGAAAPWKKLAAMSLLCASAAMAADAYPNKPLTMVIPFPPGGGVDLAGRLISEALSKQIGESVVVMNRPGAAGTIGYANVARAAKDGYTILTGYSTTTACSAALYSNLTWDPVKDFAPVAMMLTSPLIITVNPSIPVKTLPEFIAYVKAHPGEVNFGSSGVGSQAHIAAEMLSQKTGTKMVHVPFKGSGDLMPSLLSGRIQMAFTTPSAAMPYVQTGKLKALAVTGMSRDAFAPEVPTADESGVPGFDVEGWIGLFVPAGTPPQVIVKLTDALKRATETPEFRQRANASRFEVRYLGPDAVGAKVRTDIDNCSQAIRAAGIKLN